MTPGSTTSQTRAVPGVRNLVSWRIAEPHQLHAIAFGDRDTATPNTSLGAREETLTFLDRFPAFVQRREVPLSTARTHDPESAVNGFIDQSAADRHMRYRLVLPESLAAEGAVSIHDDP
jgi:hypothetical protein